MDVRGLLVLLFTPFIGECGFIDSFSITSQGLPKTTETFSMKCVISGNLAEGNIIISKDIPNSNIQVCLCSDTCLLKIGNVECMIDSTSGTVSVTKTNALRNDSTTWRCSTIFNGVRVSKDINLTIYTVPSSISYEGLFTSPQYLWENGIDMTCKTDSCTYKDPVFTWYYEWAEGKKTQFSNSTKVSHDTGGCADLEMIYSTYLVIPKNTMAIGNKELTVKFQCELSFPSTDFSMSTNQTPSVSFAVRVTTVDLKKGETSLSTNLTVTALATEILTCEPGTSRPFPTIVWYIGNDIKLRSTTNTTFHLVAANNDHDKEIYCKAYNLQTESDAVVSSKPKLYVKVKVTTVNLKQGDNVLSKNLTVTAGTTEILTCEPGTSRPFPTIVWYIGNETKWTSTSTEYRLDVVNDDHDKEIYCKAYNLQKESEAVVSSKPKLYVRVDAMAPMIVNGTPDSITLLENETYTIQCRSTPTRPASDTNWQLDTKQLFETDSVEIAETNGLVSVLSKVTVVVARQNHKSKIVCGSYISNQKQTQETQKTVIVWWPPATPNINLDGNVFPWVEGQRVELSCTSSNLGNPEPSVRWTGDYSSTITNVFVFENISYIDNNKEVRCQLINNFTNLKEEVVESRAIQLEVHFSPKLFRTQTVFAGKPNRNITIPVYFYVNPTVTTVRVIVNESTLILMNGTMFQDQKYILSIGDVELDQTISENKLTKGNRLNLTILNLQENDFSQYEIRISNMRGENGITVNITSESEPVTPTNFRLLEQKGHALIFYWKKGFNGGHRQTFWIQMTIAEQNNWLNESVINETDEKNILKDGSFIANITGLSPGTYSVRLIAVNKIGKTDPVLLNPSITIQATDQVKEPTQIGAAIGGGVGAAVVVVIAAVGVTLWKRRSKSSNADDVKKLSDSSSRNKEKTESDFEVNLNPMYESAGEVPSASNNNIYAKVNKPLKKDDATFSAEKNLYADVKKPKKQEDPKCKPKKVKKEKPGKKAKLDKMEDGTVYENAANLNDRSNETQIVYENPSCSSSDEKRRAEPSRTRNQEGLIYVEVDVPTMKDNTNRKPIIHGLEDRNDYAEIAFGKVGEPAPESDDEGDKKK